MAEEEGFDEFDEFQAAPATEEPQPEVHAELQQNADVLATSAAVADADTNQEDSNENDAERKQESVDSAAEVSAIPAEMEDSAERRIGESTHTEELLEELREQAAELESWEQDVRVDDAVVTEHEDASEKHEEETEDHVLFTDPAGEPSVEGEEQEETTAPEEPARTFTIDDVPAATATGAGDDDNEMAGGADTEGPLPDATQEEFSAEPSELLEETDDHAAVATEQAEEVEEKEPTVDQAPTLETNDEFGEFEDFAAAEPVAEDESAQQPSEEPPADGGVQDEFGDFEAPPGSSTTMDQAPAASQEEGLTATGFPEPESNAGAQVDITAADTDATANGEGAAGDADADGDEFDDFGDFEGPSAPVEDAAAPEDGTSIQLPNTAAASEQLGAAEGDEDFGDFGDFESTTAAAPAEEPAAKPAPEPVAFQPVFAAPIQAADVTVPKHLEVLLNAEKKQAYASLRARVDAIFGPEPVLEAKAVHVHETDVQRLLFQLFSDDQSTRSAFERKPELDAIIQAWVAAQIPQDVHEHATIAKELDEPPGLRTRTRSSPPAPQPAAQAVTTAASVDSAARQPAPPAADAAKSEEKQSPASATHQPSASMVDLDFLESFGSTSSSQSSRVAAPEIQRRETEGDLEIFATAAGVGSASAFTFSPTVVRSPASEYTPDILKSTDSPQIARKPSMSDAARAFLDSLPDLSFLFPPANSAAARRT